MKLSVVERLILLNILPAEGNFTTIKLTRELREELSFSEEEHAKLKFSQQGEQIRWEQEALESVGEKDVTMGDTMLDLVKTQFKKLDADNKLRDEHLSLYEKFMIKA